MNPAATTMHNLRSTTVDGVARMRLQILGQLFGIRLTAGTLR